MHFSTISEWLSYLGSVHQRDIELGLSRVKTVAMRLNLLKPDCPVIIVGGTNGKGSTVAGLNAIYRRAGFHVGTFTSPYLFKHNEEVLIDDVMASDAEFCEAFATIEKARAEISLTPFEFHTLAALLIFRSYPLDLMILEVGLGGRLDAVNIIDADIAVITSIDIDHVEWLGDTREKIGREKAGIFRTRKPAICGDFNPPQSLLAYANDLATPLYCQGKDFYFIEEGEQNNQTHEIINTWRWYCPLQDAFYRDLPANALLTQNMSTVLMAVTLLQKKLPVDAEIIEKALAGLSLPGRMQIITTKDLTLIVDVAHNSAACANLAKKLHALQKPGMRMIAVFSMLQDKEIRESIFPLREIIAEWHIAALTTKRAASTELLLKALKENEIKENNVFVYKSIPEAYQRATLNVGKDDLIVVFGSFYTVAALTNEIHEGEASTYAK